MIASIATAGAIEDMPAWDPPLAALSLTDQIRNAAPLVAIGLALLTLFTNRRLAGFDTERKSIGAWSRAGVGQVLLDTALLLLTAAILVSISPLVVSAWPPDPARQAAVMRNLLLTATLGLVAVAAVQLWLVVTRAFLHTRAWWRDRRNRPR